MRRHGRFVAEVDHVQAARRNHLGNALLAGGIEAGRAGGEHPAAQLIGPFGRRHVVDAGDKAVADEAFHRLTAAARGVEYQDLVALLLEDGARGIH